MSITSGRRLFGAREGSAVDSHERKAPVPRATEFLQLRAERLKWVRKGGDYDKTSGFSAGESSASGND